MKNILSYKIFEAFKSKIISEILNKTPDKAEFRNFIDSLSDILDFPISEFDDSVLQYMSVIKAEELPTPDVEVDPYSKEKVIWIKFWFNDDYELVKKSITYDLYGYSPDIYVIVRTKRDYDKGFSGVYMETGQRPYERSIKKIDSTGAYDEAYGNPTFAIVLDWQKLLKLVENTKRKSEISTQRKIDISKRPAELWVDIYAEPTNVQRRLKKLIDELEFIPTTEGIQNLIEKAIGGKNMLFFVASGLLDTPEDSLHSGDLTIYEEIVDSLNNIFKGSPQYFKKIESLYKNKESLNEKESQQLKDFFESNSENILNLFENEAWGLHKCITNNYTRNIIIGNSLADMSKKSIKTKIFANRKNLMFSLGKQLSEMNKLYYELFSPKNFNVYQSPKKGLLNGWVDKINKSTSVILFPQIQNSKLNHISMLTVFEIIVYGQYKDFILYEDDWEMSYPIDTATKSEIDNTIETITKELKKIK